MKTKFTIFVLGSLVAGSLMFSAGPAIARDGDRPNNARAAFGGRGFHHRESHDSTPRFPAARYRPWGWNSPTARFPVPVYPPAPVRSYRYPAYGYPVAGPAYREDLYRQLDNWRRKAAYDMSHHASREQLAIDHAHIVRLERELGLR
jgi:hypothetical protein